MNDSDDTQTGMSNLSLGLLLVGFILLWFLVAIVTVYLT
jgi:hypothetical protein